MIQLFIVRIDESLSFLNYFLVKVSQLLSDDKNLSKHKMIRKIIIAKT